LVPEKQLRIYLKYPEFKKINNRKIVGIYLSWLVGFMMFNATFNNISAISWRSVLLVTETRVPGENHRPAASH
jgi:hypothetical protein